ncbi:MAG: hypothetical protein Aurels2KO_40890 [Aureliella sp.]
MAKRFGNIEMQIDDEHLEDDEDEIDINEHAQDLRSALSDKDANEVRRICRSHPELISGNMIDFPDSSWICDAVSSGSRDCVAAILDLGFEINAVNLPEKFGPLDQAIGDDGSLEILKFLLSRGANPNIGRPLIGAINVKDEQLRMQMIKLLVEHDCDVNRLYPLYGDWDRAFTALDWAQSKPEVVEYLEAKGAKTAKELGKQAKESSKDEVVAYFEEKFGAVDQRSVIEIVPSGPHIAVHAIPASDKRKHVTLFTSGLSNYKLKTPDGMEVYQFAELFIDLPANWQYEKVTSNRWGWPAVWLKKIAQYPIVSETWLGGPLTVIANEDPPEPLAAGVPFTSLMLLAQDQFRRKDGSVVSLFRVTPLYTEERELELRDGAKALMQAFDRADVPFVVDLKRRNVAK